MHWKKTVTALWKLPPSVENMGVLYNVSQIYYNVQKYS